MQLSSANEDIIWRPHPGPQTVFCETSEFEAFYGGQAGPGKTDCLIGIAARHIQFSNYNFIILRRTFPQLEEIIDRTRNLYPAIGGEYKSGEHRWYFPSGAKGKLGHMQHDDDRYNYQGKQYQFIGFDEVTQFTRAQYLYLFSRCRTKDKRIPCRVRSTSNPGGVGHAFIKNRFKIGLTTPRTTMFDPLTGLSRIFIPGKLSDNPSLLENDPDYINRLMELPEIERLRLMEGIWDAFEGQAFPELNQDVHGIAPFEIPPEWPRYRAFDWGYSTPFAVLWFAVDFDGRIFIYDEWYGSAGGETPNKGIKMSPTEIARGIKARERDHPPVKVGPADPDIWNPRWKTMGGKNKFGLVGDSVATDMSKEGINFLRADNDQLQGRQQVHKRLMLDDKGDAQIYVFNTLKHFWRTMPMLREYEKNPEILESKQVEDHIYCVLRYFCMFKPLIPKTHKKPDTGSFQSERRRLIKAKKLAARTGVSLQQAYGRVR